MYTMFRGSKRYGIQPISVFIKQHQQARHYDL